MAANAEGRIEGGVHILPLRIYYEDTDVSGVVYHANYLRYLERGRSDLTRMAGVDQMALMQSEDPVAFTVRRCEIDWLKPARLDDLVEVLTVFTDVRGARLTARQGVRRGGEMLVRASLVVACMDLTGRARRVPAPVRDAFAAVTPVDPETAGL